MSQPDDPISLEISALREANEILRDEMFKAQSELARQDHAFLSLVKSLRVKALEDETTAVRAALYAEVALQIEKIVNGA